MKHHSALEFAFDNIQPHFPEAPQNAASGPCSSDNGRYF